jgi:hypothetical protein
MKTANEMMLALNTTAATKLSLREMKLWNMIRANSGVVMALGIPGISKSATFRTIASKLGLNYIDLRTSTMDETDLGVFPVVAEINGVKVVESAVPAWAMCANERPTLIHFEELNRCSSNIRNAALGILLERIIGTKFKFNDNVFMVASGNPVTDFDNDVEVFGTALRNRMLPIKFELSLKDWLTEYANENVHPMVINFLKSKPDYFGNTVGQLEKHFQDDDSISQFPSPRSWTFMSDYISAFPEEMRKEVMTDIVTLRSYVGEIAATSFVNYVTETFKVDVKDILKGKADLKSLDNMTIQRIAQEFQDGYTYFGLNAKERTNWREFMKVMSDEHLAALTIGMVKTWNHNDKDQKKIFEELFTEFKSVIHMALASRK